MWDLGRAAQNFFGQEPPPTRFDTEYCCYPVSFCGKDDMEKGNKILLPTSALNLLARMHVTWPMLFEVSNPRAHRTTHSGVLEFVAEEGTCYMPYWMMQNLCLKEGDLVKVCNTSLPKGSYVKLQPVTKDFLDISNPKAVLETALRHFATLSVGDNIVIQYNSRTYEIEIVETRPGPAISIIETDVQVDFAPPKDYVEPPRAPKAASGGSSPSKNDLSRSSSRHPKDADDSSSPNDQFNVFSGSGNRLDGKKARAHRATTDNKKAEKAKSVQDIMRHRLRYGVRTHCSEYDRMKQDGKIPGVLGQGEAAVVVADPNFRAFSGKGRQLGGQM